VYPNVALTDLREKFLDVAVWNSNEAGEDEVFGKITLRLSGETLLGIKGSEVKNVLINF